MQLSWRRIIIHHSATPDTTLLNVQAIRRYHIEVKGWPRIGYHFLLDNVNGQIEVIQGCPLHLTGTHTKDKNTGSLGICVIGNYELKEPGPERWAKLVELCVSLVKVFEIRLLDIYGHRDFAPTACPGRYINLDKLRDDIAREIIGRVYNKDLGNA